MQCAHIVLCRRLTALPGAIPRLGFFATQRNLANLSPEDVDPSQGADSGQGPPPEGPFASVKGALKRVWEEGEGGESPDFGKLPDPQAPGLDWREEMEYSRSVGEVPYSDMQQAGTSLGGNTPQASGPESTAKVNVLKDALSDTEGAQEEPTPSPPAPDLPIKIAVRMHVY